MKTGPLVSLLGIAVISLVGVGYLTFGVVRYEPLREQLAATLELPDSAGLLPGSPILLRGVEVGSVTGVQRARGRVAVRFAIDARYEIPVDSTVFIESLSGLGEPYVVFAPSSTQGPFVRDGQTLAGEKIRAPLAIAEVARLVAEAMEQLDPQVLDRLIATAEAAMRGTGELVPRLARSSDLVAAMLMSRSATYGQLLADLERVTPDMTWTGPAFTAAAPNFVEFGQRVDEIAEAVQRLVRTGNTPEMYVEGHGLVPFLDQLTDWIDKAGPELAPLAPALQPLADAATDSAGRLDLSALIGSAAAASAPAGALHLRVNVK
ncbi:MlaD family protein [Nocardia sp. NPDC058497]|uniref:MlaD family protein n=1 Tax=Nocardia sp. NPDC058497 TaxID=3346529 RepID=UPI003648502A